MSEQLKFYKGNESNLPSVFEVGAIYHCLDTGNTYLATSATTTKLFATNVLTLADLGIEASAGELNYMDGVTSNVQDQFDAIPKIYIQNDEPTDAPEGSLWIDLDAVSEWEAVTSVAGKTGAVTLEPGDVGAAPVSHASSSATYGSANNTNYGHVRLSASTSSTSGVTSGYAATPSAVKSAYDLANGKPSLGSTTPSAPGIASAGSATTAAKSDHVHPLQTSVSGNAGTATTLQTSRYIDGVAFNGESDITRYGTCSTSATTAAKSVTFAGNISLAAGTRITVKFTYANSAANPYFSIKDSSETLTSKYIGYNGNYVPPYMYWNAGAVIDFVYDGSTFWNMVTPPRDNSGTSGVSSLTDLGVTATATELNYVDGVTSAIQTQLDGKADSSHTQAASTITSGTFPTTYIYAKTGTDYTTGRIRNIKASSSDLTAGTSTLNSGDIYLVYE